MQVREIRPFCLRMRRPSELGGLRKRASAYADAHPPAPPAGCATYSQARYPVRAGRLARVQRIGDFSPKARLGGGYAAFSVLSRLCFLWSIALLCVFALVRPAGAQPDYKRDVMPILERNCIRCHGPKQQQGGVRLDTRDVLMSNGAHARVIVPHNAGASELIRRVSAESNDARMPPASSGLPRLTPQAIATLRAWIDAGPSFPEADSIVKTASELHWSLKPLRRPNLPVSAAGPGKAGNPARPSANPIDAFIRAKLASSGLKQSPAADRATLLRRVMYDLIGLPPSPADLDAFVADKKPGAYERVVDRLLMSPRYGERWSRHWLDTIHFADSHGFEHDIGRDNAWPFRDYVISSLNQDKPWPRFIREQLAADYFYPDNPELTPALGYLGAGTFDLSAYTTAPRNFELIDRDDLVAQTMTAFVSTTANCARCHNHKFDPIPQSDYYALQAVFSGITKGDRSYDSSPQVAVERKRWDALLTAAGKRDPAVLLAVENRGRVDAWLNRIGVTANLWHPVTVAAYQSAEGSTLTLDADGTIASGGRRPEKDTYTTTITTSLNIVTGLRLDVLASATLPMHGPGRQDNGNLHLTEIEVNCVDAGGASHPVKLARATADFNQEGWGVERAIDGDPNSAWGIFPEVGKSHHAVFTFAHPEILKPAAKLVVVMHQNHGGGHLIGLYRLSVSDQPGDSLSALPSAVEDALRSPADRRTADQQLTIAAYVLREEATAQLAKLPAQARVYAAGPSVDVPTVGMVTIAQPKPVHRLERGDIERPMELVGPGALSAISVLPARFALENSNNEAARRAALADWLASRDNPLTWRSIVNRVWYYHFGRGICDTPGDFGKMGGTPSHPELLDWLAVWFRDDAKGSLKQLHRLIVTSETYLQSSAFRSAPNRIDGDNRLLWRQNRQRLDADSYRDFAHAVSGTLDLTMGGPAVKNFSMKPGPQLTPALNYNDYDWNAPGAGRRSIYRNVWRGIADPFMVSLDFPDLGLLAPTRSFSVSALQALALYNDAFVLNCSEQLAKRIAKDQTSIEAQVNGAVRCVLLRQPAPSETPTLVGYVKQHGLAALCRVLLNSNEFLFVD